MLLFREVNPCNPWPITVIKAPLLPDTCPKISLSLPESYCKCYMFNCQELLIVNCAKRQFYRGNISGLKHTNKYGKRKMFIEVSGAR